MSENVSRLPRLSRPESPAWARAVRTFYAETFDVDDDAALVDAMNEYADLTPAERAFHAAHLAFRQVQALEDMCAALARIEARLPDPTVFAHLPTMRKALVRLARGQSEVLAAVAARGAVEEDGEGVDGEVIEDEEHFAEAPPEPPKEAA